MSSGATSTMTTHATQNIKSEQPGSATESSPMSPQERTLSSSWRTRDLPTLDVKGGLGITAPSQACIRRERSPDGAPKSPLLEIGDNNDLSSPDYDYMLSKEYFRNKRLQQSQDRLAQLRKSSGTSQNLSEASTEDGSSSASSSFRNQRSSSDSWATRASTLPTTPGTRNSITSTFSRAFSRTSRPNSTSSTPAHSRSPSPPPKGTTTSYVEIEVNGTAISEFSKPTHDTTPTSKRKEPPKRGQDNASEKSSSSDDQSNALRKSRLLRKTHSTSSAAGLLKSSISENEAPDRAKSPRPDVPPIPTSFSTSKLVSLGSPGLPSERPPTPAKLLSAQRLSTSNFATPKKKDELWNAFRNLDADYAKFASKSIAFKAHSVRTLLTPFLRNYEKHPSNFNLRPEDLDRRANILNKWWTGLIELLHGPNNQSMSGTDRPAVLDGISGIMDRLEWRSSPSPFCPLERRSNGLTPQRHNSDDSIVAGSSTFLADSVHHNVRNIFIQNLTAQMDFVVDKMSLRNASASLVAFCGKTCAFAFFFVPSMADTLVRLWDLQIDTPRRLLQAHGVGKFEDMSSVATPIGSDFPPSLQELALSSLPKYMRKLRMPSQPPVGTNNIQWRGPWLERWKGGDSDLFYVFVKHFHILATDYMAPSVTKKERLCAPGMLMVHAQILVNLDATIHRQSSQDSKETVGVGPATTFDTILVDPDAVAATLPMPPASNASRSMGENRLVMLIRDFISERPTDHPMARHAFAESIGDILQAAACRCGLFDHAAAYTLLDFMEEVLVPLTRYERLQDCAGVVIDFEFWKTVFKKMITSQNTMTEIRLYAFLYTIWDTVICEAHWKAEVCSELLLEKTLFEGRFNHWCPTVRAYYMRLLCWRVARQDGEFSELDLNVLEMFLERLRTTWSYYIYLKEQANAGRGISRPGTNPCNPVPSRRLRIVRMDRPVNDSARQWLRVDCPLPKGSIKSTSTALERNSIVPQVDADARPGSSVSTNSDEEAEQRGRGIGGFLRNLMGNKSRSTSRNPSKSNPSDSGIEMESRNSIARPSTDALQPLRSAPPALSAPTNGTSPPDSIQRRQFSFKFALEYFPNAKPLPPMRLSSPRLPYPAQQYLLTYSQKESTPSIVQPAQPTGDSKCHAKYAGHALAEWTVILSECQSFFERRKHEGIPSNKYVETPTLGVEVFRRPG